MDIKKLLGLRPPVKCVVASEPTWAPSPTVVNINRMRAKTRRRKRLIILAVVCAVVLCVACGAFSSWYTSSNGKARAAATPQPQLMMDRTPTPPPGWVAVEGMPGISFRVVTFTPGPPLSPLR